ncbi:hypothetical protein JOC77_001505 [Peribacillus deserti]|uniref:Uncharacterized protein n=1 Tax=Peribacillus deserti TaxID=673318 RepID=A0ABS2QHT6_9BACI|nr:hypothetical protein [Peribacillus deserti]MBM7692078.1 hypothetical protein [Peribacillus deserti]
MNETQKQNNFSINLLAGVCIVTVSPILITSLPGMSVLEVACLALLLISITFKTPRTFLSRLTGRFGNILLHPFIFWVVSIACIYTALTMF